MQPVRRGIRLVDRGRRERLLVTHRARDRAKAAMLETMKVSVAREKFYAVGLDTSFPTPPSFRALPPQAGNDGERRQRDARIFRRLRAERRRQMWC